ncbi:hypothetical protein OEG86_19735 [Hoeflea alexandrii]|uniref:hypothetical protein n=1 Tax=Hoeflea alexandrii TaxID=288436 RepID=UPI00226F38D0|nr:hypothetical protein [Hoeflea alexandrii]MCY0154092.1 hypothetical protein [Hoeflea alexandrii]
MGALRALLLATARHGRLVLIAGLVAGILLPGIAGMVRGVLPELVACMLGVAALRIGPTAARGSLADIHISLWLVAAYQLLLPLVLAAVFLAFGLGGTLATAMVLMAAAPSISGSPNLTIMTGHDPALGAQTDDCRRGTVAADRRAGVLALADIRVLQCHCTGVRKAAAADRLLFRRCLHHPASVLPPARC